MAAKRDIGMVASRVAPARLLALRSSTRDADGVPASSAGLTRVQTAMRHGTLPGWARWNGGLSQRYTLGAEEEVMLLDRKSVV